MAYTGSGTQEDPYIVDNWVDFKAAVSEKGAYVRLDPNAAHKVMDLNETEDRLGLQENLQMHAHIEGNGWEIRNLCTGSYDIRTNGNTVTDLSIVNLISNGLRVFWGSIFCTNCRFSILFLSKANLGTPNGTSRLTNCSLHLQFMNQDSAIVFGNRWILDYCDIVLDGPVKELTLTDYGEMNYCRVSGKLELLGGNFLFGAYNQTTQFNVIALELNGTGMAYAGYRSNSLCLIDTDLISESISLSLAENWLGLTTTQLQDADYLLNTIGFPCAKAEE